MPANESGYSVIMKKLEKELEAYFNSLDEKDFFFRTIYVEEYLFSDWLFINLDQKEKEKIYN